jgi:hypothetical protein
VFNAFDRDNVLRQKEWRREDARAKCKAVRKRLEGRTVVVLGNEVWHALGLPKAVWFGSAMTADGTTWYRVPHPSGLNQKYNDEKNVARMRILMRDIAHGL